LKFKENANPQAVGVLRCINVVRVSVYYPGANSSFKKIPAASVFPAILATRGGLLAKPNYQFEKRQRDLAKKSKQEEKRRQKLAGKTGEGSEEDEVSSPPEASASPLPSGAELPKG